MVDGKFHLDGFPDAVWLASTSALLPHLSGELADMAPHHSDLRFALDCLTQIRAPSASQVVREALWQSAIVNYCKCFDEHSNARSTALKSRKVLDPGLPRQVHRHFLNLRNKYLAHDDNAWLQAKPAAVIAPVGKSYSIEKVTVTTFRGGTLETASFGNMLLLVREALKWVEKRLDDLCDEIAAELEKVDYDVLLKHSPVQYTVPLRRRMSARHALRIRCSLSVEKIPLAAKDPP